MHNLTLDLLTAAHLRLLGPITPLHWFSTSRPSKLRQQSLRQIRSCRFAPEKQPKTAPGRPRHQQKRGGHPKRMAAAFSDRVSPPDIVKLRSRPSVQSPCSWRTATANALGGDGARTATVSFLLDDIALEDAQRHFRNHGVVVRSGTHCAPMALETLGHPDGCIRASFGPHNTTADVDAVLTAIDARLTSS